MFTRPVCLDCGEGALVLCSFALVEAAVGGFNQIGGRSSVVRVDSNANAHAERRFFQIGAKAAFDSARYIFRHPPVRVDQDHSKFVTAVSSGEIRSAAMVTPRGKGLANIIGLN